MHQPKQLPQMATDRKKEIPNEVITVGNNIARIIREKDLKLRIVAHDSDLDIEALRRYIKGSVVMGIDKALNIAKALSVDISELFKGV